MNTDLQTEIADMKLPNLVIRSHYRNGSIKQYVRGHLTLRTQGCSTLYSESLKQQALAISCATRDEGFLGSKKSESM